MLYFIVFFLILLLVEGNGGSNLIKSERRIKNIEWVIFLSIFLLIGFRGKTVGTDTISYVYQFLRVPRKWEGLLVLFGDNPEPLYTGLIMLCQAISKNYTVFLCVFAFPIAYCFARLIKQYSDDYFISVLLFVVLGVMGFCMAGMRQAVAIALCMLAYQFAIERKWFWFLFCCFIALGFHNTAWIFLTIYLLYNVKVGWKHWLAVAVAFLLGLTRSGLVMQIAKQFLSQERYKIYGEEYVSSMNYTMFIIQVILVVFCYIYKGSVIKENKSNAMLYHMAFLSLIFQAFTPILGEFFRVSMYFSFSLCILVPKTIRVIPNKKNREIAYYGLIGAGLVYVFLATSSIAKTYMMFWN